MVDANVHLLDRGTLEADVNFFLDSANVATKSNPNPDAEIVSLPVYSLIIDHPDATILWDTGMHPDAKEGHWAEGAVEAFYPVDAEDHSLESDLSEAGYGLDDIDAVITSHLHLDHAGGLSHFDGTDVPIYVHEEELKHAYKVVTTTDNPAYIKDDFDYDLNWNLMTLQREEHFEDLVFHHMPGHTPGLIAGLLHHDQYGSLLFAGDAFHLKQNYDDAHPTGGHLIWSQQDWWESFHRIAQLERDHDAQVIAGHDIDQVESIGEGWL